MGLTVGEVRAIFDAETGQFAAKLSDLERRVTGFEQAAEKSAAKTSRSFLGARAGVQSFGASIFNTANVVRAAYAAIAGSAVAVAGVLFLRKAISDSSEQEDAIRRLNTALAALGKDGARSASEAVQAFAAETQKTTRFADEATVNAAARIAAFVKEQNAIVSLTGAAQDFAQATGVDLESAANLLGKTVGSSTNALARYGVTVTGAVGSTQRLESALAGVQRLFGGQAASAALSFSGASQQLANAFGEVREAIGDLITQNPVAIALIVKLRDAFFATAEAIQSNRDALARGLLQALAAGVGVIAEFVKSLAQGSQFLEEQGVTIRRLGQAVLLLRDVFAAFFSAVGTGFQVIKAAVLGFLASVEDIPQRVRDIVESFKTLQNQSTGKLQREFSDLTKRAAELRAEAEQLRKIGSSDAVLRTDAANALIGQAFEVRQELERRGATTIAFTVDKTATQRSADAAGQALIESAFATNARLETVKQSLGELFAPDAKGNAAATDVLRTLATQAGVAKAEVDRLVASFQGLSKPQTTTGAAQPVTPVLDPEELTKGEALLKKIREEQENANAKLVSPLQEQAVILERQAKELREATLTDDQRIEAAGLLVELERKRAELLQRGVTAQASLPQLQQAVNDQLGRLASLDPNAAATFANEVGRRLGAAIGPEAQAQALSELATELGLKIEEAAAPSLARASGAGLAQGVQAALSGGNALAAFGTSLSRVAQESLERAFTQAGEGLGRLLSDVLPKSLAGLGGALTGILGGVIGALTNRTQASSAAGNVQSAVTSAQQVRGLVAGPSTVAIAQVGDSIREAFDEPTRLLEIIARNTGLAAARGGPAAAAAAQQDAVGFTLGNTSPALV